MSPLDRTSALPLWAQLADELRRRAAGGEFSDGFPTELELVDDYEVSRNTVREAMRRLRDEGLVQRQRGRRTTLMDVEIERAFPGRYSLARTIEEQGLDERSDVQALELRAAAGDECEALELEPGAAVVHLERLRFAGSEPLAFDRSWLPAGLARPLLDEDLTHGSVYDALQERCGVRVTGGWERITPVVPTAADRAALQLPRGHAAFLVERLAKAGARPVEWRTSVVRGDRYRLVSTWS